MNAPTIFPTGTTVAGNLTEDTLNVTPQTFQFKDAGLNNGATTDAHGILITEPANAIGTLVVNLIDDAAGGADDTGTVEWSYSVPSNLVQYLAAGETRVMVYTVAIVDLDGQPLNVPITITITGTNDAPVISTEAPATVNFAEDNAAISVSSSLAFTDLDIADTHSVSVAVAATGTTTGLTLNTAQQIALLNTPVLTTAGTQSTASNGTINYTFIGSSADFQYLAAGEVLTLTYTLTLSDGNTGTATRHVVITITGSNDAPTLSATTISYVDTAADDGPAGLESIIPQVGNFAATDADTSNTLTYDVTGSSASSALAGFDRAVASTYGTLYFNAATGDYRFVPDAAAIQGLKTNAVQTFAFSVTDGTATENNTITIDITGANDAAVITGTVSGNVTEASGVLNAMPGTPTATGTLTHTDRDDADVDNLFTASTQTGTYGSFTIGTNGVWTYTLDNNGTAAQGLNTGDTPTESFTVTAADG
ncbi:MAG: VCBS domain-containing protein, partial [Paracoccaceae bacterium]